MSSCFKSETDFNCAMNDGVPPLRYTRGSRRRMEALDLDLNFPPPSDNRVQVGTSGNARPQVDQSRQPAVSIPPAAVDVEALDDDVVISSPRAFAQAKNNANNNSRRTQGRPVVVDVESEERCTRQNSRNKRRRLLNQTIVNSELYINLEGSDSSKKDQPPMPPTEPVFTCPICMGSLVEEMTTKCGHIFCKACIKAALAVQAKCPTCRKHTTSKDIIRIYLPK